MEEEQLVEKMQNTIETSRNLLVSGKRREAMQVVALFVNEHPEIDVCPPVVSLKKHPRQFLVLNPHSHQAGHTEAFNALNQIDSVFRADPTAAMQDEITTLSEGAQTPSFDLGWSPEAS